MDSKRHAAWDMVLFLMIDIYTVFLFVDIFYKYSNGTVGELLWFLLPFCILSYIIITLILIIPYLGRMYRRYLFFKYAIISLFLFSRWFCFLFISAVMSV